MTVAVSVIIPARNAGATIAQTLDSLLAQTDHDWAAIIIDDGSVDRTKEIASRYASADARFLVIDGPGKGVSAARNLGLTHAQGERLVFLDSDDWIHPEFLELLGARLAASPHASAAYSGYQRVTPDGDLSEPTWSPDLELDGFEVAARRCAVPIHAVMIDRSVVTAIGGFDETLRVAEDWDLWQRVTRMGAAFVGVPQPLAFYRMSSGSLTHDVHGLLGDAGRVIARGFSNDDRVANPAAAYAAGADPAYAGDADLALSYFTLWCAAHEVGRAAPFESVLASGRLCDLSGDVDTVARIIFEGLLVGAQCAASNLADRWTAIDTGVLSLLDAIEAASVRPGFARQVLYRLDRLILGASKRPGLTLLGATAQVRLDLKQIKPLPLPPETDRLSVVFTRADEVISQIEIAAFGSVGRGDIAQLAIAQLGLKRFLLGSGALASPRFWWTAGLRAATGLRRAVSRREKPRTWVGQSLRLAALRGQKSNGQALQTLFDNARHQGAIEARAMAPEPVSRTEHAFTAPADTGDRRGFWEAWFATPDPWDYGSEYERVKYERTLSLVPPGVGRALEAACAEGMFSQRLARSVGHLVASDISEIALDRARARCANLTNISFEQSDIVSSALPKDLDLIVCSEVLYYVGDRDDLARVCERLVEALAPGGRLLTAHAFVLDDDLTQTGFDWGNRFGEAVIGQTLAEIPDLDLEAAIETELYRISLFRRKIANEAAPTPRIEHLPLGAALTADVSRYVVWGGAATSRSAARKHERTHNLPVLMYHRVAEDGPASLARYRTHPEKFAEQVRWLRANGYYSISVADAANHLWSGEPFHGRPVLITFDDGTTDFAATAWPILRGSDFSAEVFVVSDKVGGSADWDAGDGSPAALMGADQIVALARDGVGFGSHLASHRAADGLSSVNLAIELARSKAMIETWTGQPVTTLAPPFGASDERLTRLAAACGYTLGFTTENGFASAGQNLLQLPRLEVRGDFNIEAFAANLMSGREPA